jgi:Leucine Rich repeat
MEPAVVSFQDELNDISKKVSSDGSWDVVYKGVCDRKGVTCNSSFLLSNSTMRVQNSVIDLSSWRCMLLALSISVPTITGISLHNCKLCPDHISDLICTLVQCETGVKVLRLEYLSYETEDEKVECLKAIDTLFCSDVKLDCLSLRGCSLSDESIIRNATTLQSNISLKVLNLSSNEIADAGATALFKALRVNVSLRELSIGRNELKGASSLDALISLLAGSLFTAEDDSVMKAMTRMLTEMNKKTKDANKKRRKSGLPEVTDLFITKRDPSQKVNGQNIICNRNLVALDMSCNSFDPVTLSDHLESLKNKIAPKALVAAFGPCSITLILTSNTSNEVSSAPVLPPIISELSAVGVTIIT